MNLDVDYEKIKEIYGDDIIEIISDNIDIIEKNITTMQELQFDDIGGLFERCPNTFMYFPEDFKNKINSLIQTLGDNYVEIIENDISILEDL